MELRKKMEKKRTILSRKYIYLSCNKYHVFNALNEHEQSLLLSVTNNGGSICFTFTDLSNNQTTVLDNPQTGDYVIPLVKGNKMKLAVKASKAIGAYKIVKKTIKD